ncbi:YoaK family protein [Kitasatospora sp. NPDC088346]|uniref:YoaK family protein n=1 Tax=Kitasatospora sp. NPDC088346 TaxID=3364073 RepID=UPI003822CFB1
MELRRGPGLSAALVGLTVTTGLIEAVCFLALGHVFTAVMTGNLLFLAFGVAGARGLSALASAVSFGGFTVGVVAGAAVEARVDARRHRWFLVGLVVESLLLGAAAAAAWDLPPTGDDPSPRHLAVVAATAVAMGLRNVTTLRAHVPDLPTTIATRTLTALLSGAAPAGGGRPVLRRTAALGSMFGGGVLGALMLDAGWAPQVPLLAAASAGLAIAAGYGLAVARRPPPTDRAD